MKGYKHIALPEIIVAKIDQQVKNNIFYRSHAEFVKIAVKKKFERDDKYR